MTIPFTKAHGARNDFLLTWAHEAPREGLKEAAIAICDRNAGVGADGWLLVYPPSSPNSGGGRPAVIRLFNPDGGEVEMSGNGTRCAAAFLVYSGFAGKEMVIRTGGGEKQLRLLKQDDRQFVFEMNMGRPVFDQGGLVQTITAGGHDWDVTILNVGNPQCAVFVNDFEFDWKTVGAAIENHPRFPARTNVSFLKVMDGNRINVRFWERGAGFTMSSGTGSTGAMAAAVARKFVSPPVIVETLAGPLAFLWENPEAEILMKGPAELTVVGEYYYRQKDATAGI